MNLDAKYLTTPYRCAVYFVPDIHGQWWQAGSDWLGRCAATGKSMSQPFLTGISSQMQRTCTAEPRRYGWHATLKAPFKVVSGVNLKSLVRVMHELAKTLPAFDLPTLKVSMDGGFLALRPEEEVADVQHTARACVTTFHRFAMPLSEADLSCRREACLTPAQDCLLLAWGYPYVFDEFQFHLSLTGKLAGMDDDELLRWQQAAQAHFADLGPCRFDRLALFVEPTRGADFELLEIAELIP